MSVNNDHIIGATNELLSLFVQQTEIINGFVDKGRINLEEKKKLAKITEEFKFLSEYINKNIEFKDSQRFIGKMLIDAKRQATTILDEAKTEAAKIRIETPFSRDYTYPEKKSLDGNIVGRRLDSGNQSDLTLGRYVEIQEIHQKYKKSLDNILIEIDSYLEK